MPKPDQHIAEILSKSLSKSFGFILSVILLLGVSSVHAQTGPGGAGQKGASSEIVFWLIADSISGADGSNVTTWPDISGRSNDFSQGNATFTPVLRQNVVNGRNVAEMSRSNDRIVRTSFADMPTTALTTIVVYRSVDTGSGFLSYAVSGSDNEYLLFDLPALRTYVDGVDDLTTLDVTSSNFEILTHRWRSAGGNNQVLLDNALIFNDIHQSGQTMTTGGSFAIAGEQDGVNSGYAENQNFDGDVAEVIMFNTYLDSAQLLAVHNYLAARYNLTISNDFYAYESTHSSQVAGILQAGSDVQDSVNSSGLFNISTPADLTTGENLFFGHDNGAITWTTTEIPGNGVNIQRIAREWRVDEDGDVGNVTVRLDTSMLQTRPSGAYTKFVVLIDDDGDFTSGASVFEMAQNGSTLNLFELTRNLTAGQYITFGTVIPTLSFDNNLASDSEQIDPNINVSLNYIPLTAVTFDYATEDTSPVGATADPSLPFDANADYLAISTTMGTISAGTSSTTIPLNVNQDTNVTGMGVDEDGDSLRINLSNASPADVTFLFDRLVYSINDDDNPRKIFFDQDSSFVAESVGTFTIQVNLTPSQVDATNPTNVNYVVNTSPVTGGTADGGGVDYTLADGLLTIPAGFVSNTFTVTIDDDVLDEVDETIIINLSSPTNGSLGDSDSITHVVVIQDDEVPPTVQFNVTSSTGAENTSPTISITLSAISGADVTVDYTVSGTAEGGNVDYTFGSAGTATITAGNLSTTISPTIIDDTEFESDETIVFTLRNPSNASLGNDSITTYTITDNEGAFGFSGPGGVGSDDGTSAVEAWYIADSITGTNGSTFSAWNDESGNGANLGSSSAGGGIIDPTYRTALADINDHDYVDYSLGEAVLIEPAFSGIAGAQITAYMVLRDPENTNDHLVSPQYELNGDANQFLVFHRTSYGAEIFVDNSNDDAGGRSDASIDDDTWRIFSTRWRSSDGQIQYYSSGDSLRTANFLAGGSITGGGTLSVGHEQDTEDAYADPAQDFDGFYSEVILFSSYLNESRRIIVDNYLSTKYGIPLSNDDYFNETNVGAAYEVELAGIGREGEADQHVDAQSGGILRINNASDLGIGEYLMFAHNNLDTAFSTSELPAGADSLQRIAREWGLDETGDLGTVDVILTNPAVTLGNLPSNFNGYVLLIDDDGNFSNGGTSAVEMIQSGADYIATGVDIADSYITFASEGIIANFTTTTSSVNENGTSINVEVSLNNAPTTGSVIVNFATLVASSTATEGGGNDFQYAAPSPLTFTAGVMTQNITVNINDDSNTETDEIVVIELTGVTGATLGADTLHTLTIIDNDALAGGTTGPGGVRQAAAYEAWWHADSAVFSDAGTTAATNGGTIAQWNDLGANAQNHNATAVSATQRPLYNLSTSLVNGMPAIDFSGSDSAFVISNENVINGTTTARTWIFAFETGPDVTTRQFMYDEGGGTNGVNYRIEDDSLIMAIWDDDWANGAFTNGYFDFRFEVLPNTAYVGVLDFRSGSGTLRASMNGTTEGPIVIGDPDSNDFDAHGTLNVGGVGNGTRVSNTQTAGEVDYFSGKLMQGIVLIDTLNEAERTIIENYLGAKYNMAISTNDVYAYSTTHPFDAIGIGQLSGEFHVGSTSDSLLSITNPMDLANGEFLMTGHDNADKTNFVNTDVPDTTIERLTREYRVTKVGDLGSVTIAIDTTELPNPSGGFTNYAILVDADGTFSSGAQVYAMTRGTGALWQTSVDFTDGDYFTIATFEPVVSFNATTQNQIEDNTTAQVRVELNYPITDNVVITYDTTALTTAVNAVDITYPTLPNTVTINAGDSSANISLTILEDVIVEATDDTVLLKLTNADIAQIADRDSLFFLINDDDNTQEIDFSVSSGTVSEGGNLINLILRLNAINGAQNTTVQYAVTGAGTATQTADYTLAAGTAQIDAGNLTTNISIPIVDDLSDENDETIVVELSGPVNASLGLNTTLTVTITDNDAPPVLSFNTNAFGSAESTPSANFQVDVSQVSGKTIRVDYEVVNANSTASSGSDFSLTNGTLVIAAGSSSENITASITDDLVQEVAESLQIRIFDGGNLENATITNLADTSTYTINDNDAAGFRGPGGIREPNNYTFWFRADRNVFRDTVTLAQSGNGSIVQSWFDFSTNGNNADAVTGDEPLLLFNAVNSKPAVDFSAADSALLIPSAPGINNSGPFAERTIIAAFQAGSNVSNQQVVYKSGGGTNGFAIYIQNDSAYVAAWAEGATVPWAFDTVGTPVVSGETVIAVLELSVSDGGRLTGYFNADSVGTKFGKDEGVPNHNQAEIGGASSGWNFGNNDFFTGDVMEVILLNGILSNTERIIIENYLGSKYGANLTASGNDFFTHDIVHGFDVIGIGRQTSSDFQTKSQSDSLITLSNASGLDDGEYLILGNDNASISEYITTEVPGTNIERLRREWRVTETGTIGNVTLSIDTAELALTPSSGFTEYVLLVDTDGNFASGASILPMTENGSEYQVEVDFANNDYFTFAVIRPTIQFTAASSNASENNTPANIEVSLNFPIGRDVSVTVTETGGGTSTETTDFTFTDGAVTIPAGSSTINAPITVVNDAEVESDETVILQLSAPTVGVLGTNTTHTFTINDDDNFRKANFIKSDSTNTEDQAPIQVEVFLNEPNTVASTEIFFTVSGGTALNDSVDFFVQVVDTLVFPASNTSQLIDINVVNDVIDEDPETIILSLTGGSGATIGDTITFTYTITDDDDPPTVGFNPISRSGAESAQTVDLAVELSTASGKDIVVPFSSTDLTATVNDDYQLPTSSITILAGNSTDSIQFVVLNDGLTEASEQLQINIGTPTNATITPGQGTATYTILDDDGLGFRGPGGVGNLDEQVALWLRATDPGTSLSNGDFISSILDQTNNGNNGFQANAIEQPRYLENVWNNRPVISFDGGDLIEFNDAESINIGGPYDQKTIMVAFRTTTDVTTRQMIYEEGGGVRGLSIYIDNGLLYIGGYNNIDDDGGATTPWPSPGPPTNFTVFTTRPVASNSNNFMFLQFDFLAGTGSITGDVRAAINGESLVTVDGAGRLFNHPDDIGIGGINGGTVVHDGNEGLVNNYTGNIGEVVVQNFVYNPAQYVIVNNYLSTKYNVPLASVTDIYAHDVNYSYELFGIGQVNDSSHNDSQGQGLVRISNPSDLDNNEFLAAAHDGGSLSAWTSTGVPGGDTENFRILNRTWRLDETGDVGTVTFSMQNTSLPAPPVGIQSNYVLVVDSDDDFSSGASVYQLVASGGYFEVTNLSLPTDGYFTIGLANPIFEFTSNFFSGVEDLSPTVTVRLNYITQSAVTVNVDSTGNGSAQPEDFNITNNTLTIASGSQSSNVALSLVNDGDEETSETIELALTSPSIGTVGAQDTAIFSLIDDDIARNISFILTDSTGDEFNPLANLRVFADSLSNTDSLRVYYEVIGGTATAGSDFTLTADSLKWPRYVDNPNDSIRSIPLNISQDLLDEAVETVIVRISSPFQAALGSTTQFTYNITDDDPTPTVDWSSSAGSGPESNSPVELAILSLSAVSGQDVTVNYSNQSADPPTNGGIDYNLTGTSITIAAGATSDTIVFTVFDDAIADEGTENVVIQIDGATNATPAVMNSQFTYSILDDDGGFGPLGPGGVGDSDELAFWLRADSAVFSDLGTTAAGDGVSVRQWNDLGGNGNNAVEGVTTSGDSIPSFDQVSPVNSQSALEFDAASFEFLTIPNNTLINNNGSGYTRKTLALAFEVGATPTADQVIYEQGGGGNGFNVYHGADGNLHFGAWSTGASPSWGYTEVTAAVAANADVFAIFEIDAGTGDLSVYINGDAVSTASTGVNSTLDSHGGMIGIGATFNQTRFSSGTITPDSNYFDGRILELAHYNERVMTVPARRILRNYFSAKYGISIGAEDRYAHDGTGHGVEVFGIGADNSEIHIESKGSGIIRFDNPQSINDGDYLMAGHDGGSISAYSTTNTPPVFANTFMQRIARSWRVDETNDFGQVRVSVDTTLLPDLPSGFEDIYLLVSQVSNFATYDTLIRFAETFGNDLRASFDFTDDRYFTIATVQNVSAQDGPWNDPNTWVIGVPAVDEAAFLQDSVWLTQNTTASVVIGLDNAPADRGKLNLQSFTLSVLDSLIILGFGPPSQDSTTFTAGTGRVDYGSTGEDIFIQPLVYYDLTVSGTGRRYLNSATVIQNDFTIDDNPQLIPNGNNMEIRGDWSSAINATFTPGGATVTFNGTGPQQITPTNSRVTFNNLVIDNSGGDVTLGDSVEISGTLTLAQNDIILGSEMLIISNTAPGAIVSPGNNTSYIQADGTGMVRRSVTAGNSYVYPIGDASGDYTPFTFEPATVSGSSPAVDVSVTDSRFSSIDAGQTHITRYWTFESSGITSSTFDIIFQYTDADVAGGGNESDLVPIKFSTDADTSDFPTFVLTVGANTLEWQNLNSVSIAGAGAIPVVTTPVELLFFVAQLQDNDVMLQWATATELDNDRFEVEWSRDAENFEYIAELAGAGTISSRQNYQYVDTEPTLGTNYYRLKQIDFDGTFEYSQIVSVQRDLGDIQLKVDMYPNPVEDRLIIDANLPIEGAKVVFYNLSGGIVLTTELSGNEDGLDVSELATGVYQVAIITTYGTELRRLLKTK